MFVEYIELDYANDAFFDAIVLAYKLNPGENLLVASIRRACKYKTMDLVRQYSFTKMLRRTPQLCVELLVDAVEHYDKTSLMLDRPRLRCPACRQFFTLQNDHQLDGRTCGWCGYEGTAGVP